MRVDSVLTSSDAIDSEYPDMCTTTLASVTALHIYQGSYLPDRYSNVLLVGDFAKVQQSFPLTRIVY